jgi:hypothetical protein
MRRQTWLLKIVHRRVARWATEQTRRLGSSRWADDPLVVVIGLDGRVVAGARSLRSEAVDYPSAQKTPGGREDQERPAVKCAAAG